MKYAKITLQDNTSFFLKISLEGPGMISGIEVDKDGDEITPRGYHNRLRIIDRKLISKCVEMRMNNKYATLERVS